MFLDELTPREHLTYMSRLRIDANVPPETKQARVEAVLSEMRLQDCGDQVGSSYTCVPPDSGGCTPSSLHPSLHP